MAESSVDAHVMLSRSVLAISEDEAKAFFNTAAENAERLGEENYERWYTMLSIGEVAGRGSMDDPKLAYRLARFAEPTYEHMGKYSHLSWERTLRTIAQLSPTSVFPILSRWEDRAFGSIDEELHFALDELCKMGHLAPDVVLAMFPAHGQMPGPSIDVALQAKKYDLCEHIALRYIAMRQGGAKHLKKILDGASSAKHPLPRLTACFSELEDEGIDVNVDAVTSTEKKEDPDWDTLLAGLNLTLPDNLKIARKTIAKEDGFWGQNIWKVLILRVLPGKEASFLDAVRALISEPIKEFLPFDQIRIRFIMLVNSRYVRYLTVLKRGYMSLRFGKTKNDHVTFILSAGEQLTLI